MIESRFMDLALGELGVDTELLRWLPFLSAPSYRVDDAMIRRLPYLQPALSLGLETGALIMRDGTFELRSESPIFSKQNAQS